MNSSDTSLISENPNAQSGTEVPDLLADWRQSIRERVLQNRRQAALLRGEADAPLEAFAGDERELTQEVDRELEAYINALDAQRELMEADFLELTDDECESDADGGEGDAADFDELR
ncbi:MAG: hypothetical protein WDO56_15795 [Gammaproteobacteria bacterium]